jgi:hypothetical protein
MIHFAPESPAGLQPQPYHDAVARLASIRGALRLVEPRGDETVRSSDEDQRFEGLWSGASDAARRCFAASSERTIDSATAGLEAVLTGKSRGDDINPVAVQKVADRLREGLRELEALLVGP